MKADRIFILNEAGGNLGSNFKNATETVVRLGQAVIFSAVLHHDDCLAASVGMREPIEETVRQVQDYLSERGFDVPVIPGFVLNEGNHVTWDVD